MHAFAASKAFICPAKSRRATLRWVPVTLGRANSRRKILVRADMITRRVNRRAHQLENDITSTLPTTRKNLVLPEEYLMGRSVAEMQYLIDPGDPNVFVRNAEHEGVRDHCTRAPAYWSPAAQTKSLS
jgi:hypothetical protein